MGVDSMTGTAAAGKQWALLTNCVLAEQALQRVVDARASEPRLAVLYGRAGEGKSVAIAAAGRSHDAVALQVRSVDTRKTFMQRLSRELALAPRGTLPEMVDDVAEELARSRRPLIIDEMDYLVRNSAIELVRDLHEIANVPILMVGEERLPQKLARWERFHSRVLVWERARALSLKDAQRLAAFYCGGLAIADAWLQEAIRATAGNARRVTVNLNSARDLASRKGWREVTLEGWREARGQFYTGETEPLRG